jgi:hypothetical protein
VFTEETDHAQFQEGVLTQYANWSNWNPLHQHEIVFTEETDYAQFREGVLTQYGNWSETIHFLESSQTC